MLRTLADQLYFVRAVQAVDTTGVEPLRALRDETKEAEQEGEERIERGCNEALAKEEIVGKFYKRIRRKAGEVGERDVETMEDEWRPLDAAERRVGKYFVVDKGK
jgi:glutamyl-tRNA amidotransferase complex subunit Gta3